MQVLGILSKIAKKGFSRGAVRYGKRHPAAALPKAGYDALKTPKSDRFSLGFAKTDIMPDDILKKKYWVAGYKTNNPATGVLDPMTASAVWLDDNSGRGGVFLVSADTVGMSSVDCDIIKDSMREELAQMGCRGVLICSTHNHAGIDTLGYWGRLPLTGRDPKFMAIVHEGIRRVMREAYRSRKKGDLFHGSIEAPDVLRDSRDPQVFSKVLTRLRFAPADGSRETWLLNFASHSESMLGENSLISADFPCYLRREILERSGAESIYFVGAIGGLIRPKELDEDNIASTKLCGRLLGEAATQITAERRLAPILNLVTQRFYADAENYMLLFASKLRIFQSKRCAAGQGEVGYAVETEMTYLNLDGLQLLFLPGELFPELAYGGFLPAEQSATGKGPEINPPTLTEIAQDENLLIFGLCNDMTGYVVPPNDFYLDPVKTYFDGGKDHLERKHYEETNSLGPRTAEIIAQTFAGIMETVRGA